MRIIYPITEQGKRVGEYHHNAKLSDADVELMRDIYEEGFVGYRTLARFFGVSLYTVKAICKYHRRSATAMGYKTVEVSGGAVSVKRCDLPPRGA